MVTSDFIRRVMICRLPIPSVSGHLALYRPVYRRMVNHPLASFDRGFTAIWDRRRRQLASHCSRHLPVVKIALNGPGFGLEQYIAMTQSHNRPLSPRSEERRVGKEWVSPGRSVGALQSDKKKNNQT